MIDRQLYAIVLGAYVRASREARSWNQHGLASEIGISQSFLCKLESGARIPDAHLLGVIAASLGTNIANLEKVVPELTQMVLKAASALLGLKLLDADLLFKHLGEESTRTLALAAARTTVR